MSKPDEVLTHSEYMSYLKKKIVFYHNHKNMYCIRNEIKEKFNLKSCKSSPKLRLIVRQLEKSDSFNGDEYGFIRLKCLICEKSNKSPDSTEVKKKYLFHRFDLFSLHYRSDHKILFEKLFQQYKNEKTKKKII